MLQHFMGVTKRLPHNPNPAGVYSVYRGTQGPSAKKILRHLGPPDRFSELRRREKG